MSEILNAGDKLLDAWLNLSSTLWNTRLVSSMTYNEAHVLGILLRRRDDAVPQTATDLIARTHLLKSQMNKVLTTLESKLFITRERAKDDKRLVYIRLTPEGEDAYLRQHVHIEALLNKIIERIGVSEALSIADRLNEVTHALGDILPDA